MVVWSSWGAVPRHRPGLPVFESPSDEIPDPEVPMDLDGMLESLRSTKNKRDRQLADILESMNERLARLDPPAWVPPTGTVIVEPMDEQRKRYEQSVLFGGILNIFGGYGGW